MSALGRRRVISSVVELTEQSSATLDPMLDGLVAVEQDRQHEVSRVAGGRQNATSFTRLIHRALVSALHSPTHQRLLIFQLNSVHKLISVFAFYTVPLSTFYTPPCIISNWWVANYTGWRIKRGTHMLNVDSATATVSETISLNHCPINGRS